MRFLKLRLFPRTAAHPNQSCGNIARKKGGGQRRHGLDRHIMNPVSAFAIYFIIWWISLFAILSIGLKTQDETGEVVPGTSASAPQGSHMWRVVLINTLIATLLFAVFYYVFAVRGWNFDQLPQMIPTSENSNG